MQITQTTESSKAKQHEEHIWLSSLVRELFQTECSAKRHPMIEADRLGDVPPARALRAVAVHAEAVLAELPLIAKGHFLPVSTGGKMVGATFSMLRNYLADLLLNAEKSYRGTLLGMRHGIDLVELIQHVALAEGDAALAAWCAGWLETRRPLVDAVARELAWFAANPERSLEAAVDNPFAYSIQTLVHGFENIAEKLRPRVRRGTEN